MSDKKMVILDGNEAAASVAYRLSEVVAIYPITPSSPMAEWADQWRSEGKKNIWGALPVVEELQSEGGAAGALHGALQAGAFGTTFTASQGLLLMIPNMYKIAGELTPATMHVTARTLATHALSIFGDHSDVMACRSTGWAMLASNSVQEAHDLALVAQIATLEARIPFIHFFDGFRTSHEVGKILPSRMTTFARSSTTSTSSSSARTRSAPTAPFFAAPRRTPTSSSRRAKRVLPSTTPYRASCSRSWIALPPRSVVPITSSTTTVHRMQRRVIIVMGSGAEAAEEAVDLMAKSGEKVGLLKVRLYRPFDASAFIKALPATVKSIAVLDRCKEPGAAGEPLYQDVVTVLAERAATLPFAPPSIIGGRYGLSSKEFTPAMVKGIFDELKKTSPKKHFTIGIDDDISHSSLAYDPSFSTEDPKTVRALFYGLGSDGTVGANKNSIKIIGEQTSNYAQGYFVYDSKKSGSMTTSHLRFGPDPIRSTYLITRASFVACHNFSFLEKMNVLEAAMPGAVFLLNSPYPAEEVWDKLPKSTQEEMLRKKIEFYVIDGYTVARDAGMGTRINTIMQTCFFAISGVLPAKKPSSKSRRRSRKPTASAETRSSRRTLPPLTRRWRIFTRSHCLPPRRPTLISSRPSPPRRRSLSATSWARSPRAVAICFLSAPFPQAEPSPQVALSGKSATSRSSFLSGTRTFASSAANALWFARTPSSAPRSTLPNSATRLRRPSSGPSPSGKAWRMSTTPFR